MLRESLDEARKNKSHDSGQSSLRPSSFIYAFGAPHSDQLFIGTRARARTRAGCIATCRNLLNGDILAVGLRKLCVSCAQVVRKVHRSAIQLANARHGRVAEAAGRPSGRVRTKQGAARASSRARISLRPKRPLHSIALLSNGPSDRRTDRPTDRRTKPPAAREGIKITITPANLNGPPH